MPCYRPLQGYRVKSGKSDSGKWGITFNPSQGFTDLKVNVPCGQCIGCRLEKSRQWAMRCVHEMKQHEFNCFITLTFDDHHKHAQGSLVKSDFQNFMKRLRKNTKQKIRYFHCGEYGEQLERPHHHAILFGYDFPDKKYFKRSRGNNLYTSEILNKAWQGQGYNLIGEANFETAAYCARYIMKKMTGPGADEYYGDRIPEYTTMSRRPGIGKTYYEKYKDEIFPDDFVIMRNTKMKPPKYYENILDADHPKLLEQIKANREKQAKRAEDFGDISRLRVKEACTHEKVNRKKREYENVM